MQAVVMAGGEGSRLRPLTINRPKPMVAIVNRPCLGHIFDLLKSHDMADAVVTLQYLAWGEMFSDMINTGIYVIEPRLLERYPVGEAFDFSKDLFPQLLADGEPLYGYVADGYWLFNIWAEAADERRALALANEYANRVGTFRGS